MVWWVGIHVFHRFHRFQFPPRGAVGATVPSVLGAVRACAAPCHPCLVLGGQVPAMRHTGQYCSTAGAAAQQYSTQLHNHATQQPPPRNRATTQPHNPVNADCQASVVRQQYKQTSARVTTVAQVYSAGGEPNGQVQAGQSPRDTKSTFVQHAMRPRSMDPWAQPYTRPWRHGHHRLPCRAGTSARRHVGNSGTAVQRWVCIPRDTCHLSLALTSALGLATASRCIVVESGLLGSGVWSRSGGWTPDAGRWSVFWVCVVVWDWDWHWDCRAHGVA